MKTQYETPEVAEHGTVGDLIEQPIAIESLIIVTPG